MKKNISVIVATHKQYQMPKDKLYIPLQVGAKGKKSFGYRKKKSCGRKCIYRKERWNKCA